jgi:hypothetical protein
MVAVSTNTESIPYFKDSPRCNPNVTQRPHRVFNNQKAIRSVSSIPARDAACQQPAVNFNPKPYFCKEHYA